jgi:hypothetical protein
MVESRLESFTMDVVSAQKVVLQIAERSVRVAKAFPITFAGMAGHELIPDLLAIANALCALLGGAQEGSPPLHALDRTLRVRVAVPWPHGWLHSLHP